MLMFIFLIGLFAVSTASKPCCLKNQFEATLIGSGATIANGLPSAIDTTVKLFYDYDNKRQRTDSVDEFGNRTSSYTFFGQHLVYGIDSSGMCHKSPMQAPMADVCIPANATFRADSVVGSPYHNVDTETWEFNYLQMVIRLTVSANDCTPVVETIIKENEPGRFILNYAFGEYTPGIRDPMAFDLPQSCKGL